MSRHSTRCKTCLIASMGTTWKAIWYVMALPCPNFSGGVDKLPLKFGQHIAQPLHNYWDALITRTEKSAFWGNFHHWRQWKLTKWQLSVQPVHPSIHIHFQIKALSVSYSMVGKALGLAAPTNDDNFVKMTTFLLKRGKFYLSDEGVPAVCKIVKPTMLATHSGGLKCDIRLVGETECFTIAQNWVVAVIHEALTVIKKE